MPPNRPSAIPQVVLFTLLVFAAKWLSAAEEGWTVEGPDPSKFVLETSGVVQDQAGATLHLRSVSADSQTMGGTSMTLDATLFREHRLVVEADIRSDGPNVKSSLWVRVNGINGVEFFDNGFERTVQSTSWQRRRIAVPLSGSAQKISFGLMQRGPGITDARGFRMTVAPDTSTDPAAEALLQAAINEVRNKAYYSSRIDWDSATSELHRMNQGASSTDDAYPVIEYLLHKLGDQHSFVMKPDRARATAASGTASFPMRVDRLAGAVVQIVMPAYQGTEEHALVQFAAAGSAEIRAASKAAGCGWIVDLRGDRGGNMWPMLGALQPLLGKEPYGYRVDSKGAREPWTLGERFGKGKSELHAKAIAVLIGPYTASSGEAVAVAFRGLENVRTFGSPTAGLSSGNATISLPDGGLLLLTTGMQADRLGRVYGRQIQPDEPVADEFVIDAAMRWVRATSGCTVDGQAGAPALGEDRQTLGHG